jgi:B9 domain-containing protein 2
MAELHIVGSIDSGHGFAEAAGLSDLFLKWTLESGPNFRVVQGLSTGQTHCDHPDDAEAAVWSHPLDVHYTLKGIDGWPRISLEVWGVDRFGRNELAGYGVCMVPTTPGLHRLECATWRPSGTLREQLSSAPRLAARNCARRRRELRAAAARHPSCACAHLRPSARAAFFLGGVPVLKHKELVASPVDRFRLQTEPSGVVQINIGVVVKDFKKYGVSVS